MSKKYMFITLNKTRMHSSRMRTARSSSRSGGAWYWGEREPPWDQAPPWDQVHPPLRTRYTPWDQPPPGPDPPGLDPLRDQALPLVDRHTLINILPCPKPRLRAVIRAHLCVACALLNYNVFCKYKFLAHPCLPCSRLSGLIFECTDLS